ncbi:MAG: hypothetical protein WBD20_02400 [Pirellulaceae bacterium]
MQRTEFYKHDCSGRRYWLIQESNRFRLVSVEIDEDGKEQGEEHCNRESETVDDLIKSLKNKESKPAYAHFAKWLEDHHAECAPSRSPSGL